MEVLFNDKLTGIEAVGLFSQVFLYCEYDKPYTKLNDENQELSLGQEDFEENVKLDSCPSQSEEEIQMITMGLPLSFGKQKTQLKKPSKKEKTIKRRKPAFKPNVSLELRNPSLSVRNIAKISLKIQPKSNNDKILYKNCLLALIFWETLLKPKWDFLCDLFYDNMTCNEQLPKCISKGYEFPSMKLCPSFGTEIFLEDLVKKGTNFMQRSINLFFVQLDFRKCFIDFYLTKDVCEDLENFHATNSCKLTHCEEAEQEFNTFWTEYGYNLVSNSWAIKYSDYMVCKDSNSEEKDMNYSENDSVKTNSSDSIDKYSDYSALWQDLWNEHWCFVYEEEKGKFLQQYINYLPIEQTNKPCEDIVSGEKCTIKEDKGNALTSSTSSRLIISDSKDESDGEPPEEKPIEIKRSHEEDLEENADLSFQFQNAGLAVEMNPKDFPAPVKVLQYKKLKRTNDCTKTPGYDSVITEDSTRKEQDDSDLLNINPTTSENTASKKFKKKKGIPNEMLANPELTKYWAQRYRLFSKFDKGIKLDAESWYSVTPERISKHIARKCQSDFIVDAFCGAGGNTIQFAFTCQHVLAIDIDPQKIELARHNASIYGVSHKIEFVVGDFMKLGKDIRADAIFVSMPWGGPEYLSAKIFDLNNTTPNCFEIMEICQKVTKNIALFVPRNSNNNQLVKMAGHGNKVEIEQNILDKKLKTITAYYGDFIE